MEARLIKDILPKFNRDLRDDKTFPYLEIDVREDFPRVRFTREPKGRDTKLYGPFTSPRQLRGAIQVLQKIFKFRTCDARHRRRRQALAMVPPLPAAFHRPMHRALQFSHLEGRVPQEHQAAAKGFWKARKNRCWPKCARRWPRPPKDLQFEEAGRLRDEIEMLESLDERGALATHVQPEVFPIDPKKGLAGLQKVLHLPKMPRTHRRRRHRPHRRARKPWPPWCSSSTACPSSRAISGCGSATCKGVDDFASIHEVVARRFTHLREDRWRCPTSC